MTKKVTTPLFKAGEHGLDPDFSQLEAEIGQAADDMTKQQSEKWPRVGEPWPPNDGTAPRTHAIRTSPAKRVARADKIRKILDTREIVGGDAVSYYPIEITHPLDPKRKPYTAECLDIIEALGMSYAEGTAFKALWRRCAVRQGLYRRDTTDAEKLTFMSKRILDDVVTPKGKKA